MILKRRLKAIKPSYIKHLYEESKKADTNRICKQPREEVDGIIHLSVPMAT